MKSRKQQYRKKPQREERKASIKQSIIDHEEEIKNVSYIELYKYSNKKEKLLILIGVIGAIIQGCTIPFMYVLLLLLFIIIICFL